MILIKYVISSPSFNTFQSAYRERYCTEKVLFLPLCWATSPQLLLLGKCKSQYISNLALVLTLFTTLVVKSVKTSTKLWGLWDCLKVTRFYLGNRSEQVGICIAQSDPSLCLLFGVSQGSVLVPLLYMNFHYIHPPCRVTIANHFWSPATVLRQRHSAFHCLITH